jgi:hypothetical protein
VMHVAEPVRISSFGMAPVPPLPKGYRGAWESRLRLLQSEDPNVRVEHRLEEGDVGAAILRVARETQCDLIVMASSERTWLGRLWYGSVTNEVESKAPCPVFRVGTQMVAGGLTARGDPRGTKESTKRYPLSSANGEDHDLSSHDSAPDGLLVQRR